MEFSRGEDKVHLPDMASGFLGLKWLEKDVPNPVFRLAKQPRAAITLKNLEPKKVG